MQCIVGLQVILLWLFIPQFWQPTPLQKWLQLNLGSYNSIFGTSNESEDVEELLLMIDSFI